MKYLSVIVPVYGDWPSLSRNIASLRRYYRGSKHVHVYYINDCGPDSDAIGSRIRSAIKGLSNFHYTSNDHNIGFLRTCNRAVFSVVPGTSDIMLLNSDTEVTKDFIEEMCEVLITNERTGIVTPRSNNATIWSVPMDGRFADFPRLSYAYWKRLRKSLPRTYCPPTAHGFCMLIRRSVIDEIGLFDEAFGDGYGEENDFTLRAERAGWVCATANFAFVFHLESRSFGVDRRDILRRNAQRILEERYPGYHDRVAGYVRSVKEPDVQPDSMLWRIVRNAFRTAEFWHNNGLKKSVERAGAVASLLVSRASNGHLGRLDGQVRLSPGRPDETRVRIWVHELSCTGAPLVLYDVLREGLANGDIPETVTLNYPLGAFVDDAYVEKLMRVGVLPRAAAPGGTRFAPGEIVILNSCFYDAAFFDELLTHIEDGTVTHLLWYIHEDDETWVSTFWDFDSAIGDGATVERYAQIAARFHALLEDDRVTIYAPSDATVRHWERYFGSRKNLVVMPGRVAVSTQNGVVRSADDFESIRFVMVASRTEARKGQLPVIYALEAFFRCYYLSQPELYRKFSLDIVGVGSDPVDFYSVNIKRAVKPFGELVHLHTVLGTDDMAALLRRTNVTITYSLSESFSMSTMEGMAFGHPIVRSEASGVDEQLRPGVNGWGVSTDDWYGLVQTLEVILSRTSTSNEQLARMSKEAVSIAQASAARRYQMLDDLRRLT